MKSILVDCDGAPIPPGIRADVATERRSLRHQGSRSDLTVKIVSPSSMLLSHVDEKLADLVRIAAYIYAADQSVSRGGEADVYGDSWKRNFTILIPVSDPDFWNDRILCERLSEVLNFASGDYWRFSFSRASPEYGQLVLETDPSITLENPDCVYLFSGGLDSLCAVLEAAEMNGRRPLLLGHSPAFNVRGKQHALVEAVRDKFKGRWHYPFMGATIHLANSEARDFNQRTRAFLYSSLGAVIANKLELSEVFLADNGVVSLNLPINDELFLARASRSTHPKFIRLFNEFLKSAMVNAPQVINPLWNKTRSETISVLKDLSAPELLEISNSCSHPRFLTKMQSHCGVCSQCIDRRYAILAAGLEEYFPPERYKVDIFRQSIDDWKDKTMALSYVRFANIVEGLDGTGLFERYTELYDCIDPSDPNYTSHAEQLVSLLQRHAAGVQQVMDDQIIKASQDITRESLPESCLIRLLAGSGKQKDRFRYSNDCRQIWLGDEEFNLTTNQSRIIELFVSELSAGRDALSLAYILETLEIKSKNLFQIFRSCENWEKLIVKAPGKGMFRLNIN